MLQNEEELTSEILTLRKQIAETECTNMKIASELKEVQQLYKTQIKQQRNASLENLENLQVDDTIKKK